MEKKLEVLKRALELGAYIEVNFHDNEDLHQAEQKAKELNEMLGKETKYLNRGKNQWFQAPYEALEPIKVFSFGPNKEEETA